MNFANNLKYLREKRGLKQTELCDLIGFKQSQWSSWEIGSSVPRFLDLIKISDYFNISETDLIHTDLSKSEKITPKSEITDTFDDNDPLDMELLLKDMIRYLKKDVKRLELENRILKKELGNKSNFSSAAENNPKYKKK